MALTADGAASGRKSTSCRRGCVKPASAAGARRRGATPRFPESPSLLLLLLGLWGCPAAEGVAVTRGAGVGGLLPTDTVWLNASAQCAQDVVCTVNQDERWLISSNMTVDGLIVNGVLKWDDTVPDIVLTIGWLHVEKGGLFLVGTALAPIGKIPGVTATIYVKQYSVNRHEIYGERFIGGDGSIIKIFGLPKQRAWTLLNRTAPAGSRELFLKHDPVAMGWNIGDRIGVATTSQGNSTKHRIVDIRSATDERLRVASVLAGAQEAQFPAANAIDGNLGSMWSSYGGAPDAHWLRLDLEKVCNITRVRIYFQDPRYAPNYLLEVRTTPDGPWQLAANVTDGRFGWQEVALNSDKVYSLRMFAVYTSMWNRGYNGQKGSEPAWSGLWLNEIQVFGRAVGATMPTVIVVDPPLTAEHLGGLRDIQGQTFELAAEVVNMERTVTITGDHADFYDSLEGYSTMMMNAGVMDVRHTRLEYCGRRNKLGKYCLHWHLVGQCPDCVFQGNAIVDSQQVGITIHGTHKALIQHNVLWDVRAAGIYTEDGNEMNNVIHDNVIICSWWQVCAVPWLTKTSLQAAGIYLVGMTNDIVENRIAGYEHCLYTPGGVYPYGQGYAYGKVCPQNTPFGKFKGNVNHDCARYGLYLDNQYPRNLIRDEDGFVKSGCGKFTADGQDNGVIPASAIEDQLEYHNTFVGMYSLGDISFQRYTSVNNGHAIYWKTSKNFADNKSHHVVNSTIANDSKDPFGRLQILGPSGPFTFRFTNVTFLGGPVGEAALCAGQHCGLGGAGGPCNVQYVLEGVDWSRLLAWQKKIKFGVNSASFGFVQPIFLSRDNVSLGGHSTIVSQHLNGFRDVGCQQQNFEWDNGFACPMPIRRLNFWSFVQQGNLTLQGPGYNTQPNFDDPVKGLNAGIMQFEPMHAGYGLPVIAGANYTVTGDWHGDVAVEFSDAIAAALLSKGPETLELTVVNGTSCFLSSDDPRDYLSPLGFEGQAAGVMLEESMKCMIHGAPAISSDGTTGATTTTSRPITGRPNGTCQFPNPPTIKYEWDPACFFGGLGCFADGINVECAFCGSAPFKNCTNTTTMTTTMLPSTTTTTATSTTTMPPATTTTFVDSRIKSLEGPCLVANETSVQAASCNPGDLNQQWAHDEALGTIKNILCLSSETGVDLVLEQCVASLEAQSWTYDKVTGQLMTKFGMCLEINATSAAEVRMANCTAGLKAQQWNVGSWKVSTMTSTTTTTTTTTLTPTMATTTTTGTAGTPTTSATASIIDAYKLFAGLNCYAGHGGEPLPDVDMIGNMPLQSCLQACVDAPMCQGALVTAGINPTDCWLRTNVDQTQCVNTSGLDFWLHKDRATTATTTPSGAATPTTTTTTKPEMGIRSFYGRCLVVNTSLPEPGVEVTKCSSAEPAQRWQYLVDTVKGGGAIQNQDVNKSCLFARSASSLGMAPCETPPTQGSPHFWSFDLTSGQVKTPNGTCLQSPDITLPSRTVVVAPCDTLMQRQIWSIGDWQTVTTTTTTSAVTTTTTMPPSTTTTSTTTTTARPTLATTAFKSLTGACRTATGGGGNFTVVNTSAEDCRRTCLLDSTCVAVETNSGGRCELHLKGTTTSDPSVSNYACFLKTTNFSRLEGACRTSTGGGGNFTVYVENDTSCRELCALHKDCVGCEVGPDHRCEIHWPGTTRSDPVAGYTCYFKAPVVSVLQSFAAALPEPDVAVAASDASHARSPRRRKGRVAADVISG